MKRKKNWRTIALMLAAILVLTGTPAGPAPTRAVSIAEGAEAEPERKPEATPTPTPTPKPTEAPAPEPTAEPQKAPEPTEPAAAKPEPPIEVEASAPAQQPDDAPTPEATDTPAPTDTPQPEDTPEPTSEPTSEPDAEATQTAAPENSPAAPEETPGSDGEIFDGEIIPDESADAEDAEKEKHVDPYTTWFGVQSTWEEGMPIPIYYQSDYPETLITIRGIPRSVKSSGCGAACAAMVTAYLTGDEVTPKTEFQRAIDTGRYNGTGLGGSTVRWLLSEHGVKTEYLPKTAGAIRKALREGKPIIAHMGKGIFTNGGHYVVLKGIASDGKILINDPISPTKTHCKFPIMTLLTQAGGLSPFIACWVEEPEESVEAAVDQIANAEPAVTPAPEESVAPAEPDPEEEAEAEPEPEAKPEPKPEPEETEAPDDCDIRDPEREQPVVHDIPLSKAEAGGEV